MRNGFLILIIACFSFQTFAQSREETKKEKKAKARLEEKEELLEMVSDSTFVLDARSHFNRYSHQRQLTSNNFIYVEGDKIIIQTSNPFGIGYNGLGGITLEGNISTYEITEGKKNRSPVLRIDFTNGVIGHGTMFITLSRESATARLTDNWGNRNSWLGRLLEPETITNYTGMSLQ